MYAYVNNNPVVYSDPSGHCRGYYDIGSGVATDDQECWDFLHDKFCIGGICSAWQERISGFDILPVCSSEPCLYFGEYYWTKSELEVLSNGLFLVHTVLGNAGYDDNSLLGGITFQRTHGVGYSITFPTTLINLSEVNRQALWHEIGHSIDFRNNRTPQDEYFKFATEFSCTPWYDLNDFCFRDYCHREYPRWQRPYTGDHPEYWADAFSAWVYMKLYGSPPSFWVESPYQPEWKAIWRAVEWSLAVALE